MKERKPRQTLTRISVSSIARKIYAIAVSPNPTWDEYEWLVNTSKNEIVVNDFKRALEIDVLDTSSTFDRMNGDKMAELMRDQKIISKALALLIELQDETRVHRIWAQKHKAYDQNVTRTLANKQSPR
ncbi:hypothetical protein N8224_01245 [Gammaproteobacteria bacterium]|jgi:hypothetical protein|nr:hypothetical protein [Gammaproteobacteria bacterium]